MLASIPGKFEDKPGDADVRRVILPMATWPAGEPKYMVDRRGLRPDEKKR